SANPGARSGPHVAITVSDTGTGIPPELLARIFDPFFTTKAAGKGTGLGLSTVLGILKGHGGFLQVQSVVGRGTDFRLYFPASPKPVAKAGPTLPMPLPHGKGETVLLIDDESAVRFVVKTILKKHGYNVIEAA